MADRACRKLLHIVSSWCTARRSHSLPSIERKAVDDRGDTVWRKDLLHEERKAKDEHPMGIWNGYSYLPSVAFLAGVPGHKYSSDFNWDNVEYVVDSEGIPLYGIWESSEAYDRWFYEGDTVFVGILFNAEDDFGLWQPDSISKKASKRVVANTRPGPDQSFLGFTHIWSQFGVVLGGFSIQISMLVCTF